MQWTVSTMERTLNDSESGLEGVVNILHWQVIDSETVDEIVHSGRCYGTVGLSEPDACFALWFSLSWRDYI